MQAVRRCLTVGRAKATAGVARRRCTVDAEEIRRFAKLSPTWWDPHGPMKELHRMNPLRIGFIRKVTEQELHAATNESSAASPLKGLRILDVGCGGGIACEPLARLGATVVGIDANEAGIEVARLRLDDEASDLKDNLSYECVSAEELVERGDQFDVVTALEIVEHVSSPDAFVAALSKLSRPGGLLFMSTLNKTYLSYALSIVFAERIAGLVPAGTHDWNKYISPEDLTRKLRAVDFVVTETRGMHPTPLLECPLGFSWDFSTDTSVNYLLAAIKKS
ncbi:Ubiquinone biosynthesis O-methyltransferase [Diplonema papillatum]|nr:Ubiquinone biosynthesis O-methyltransferase [Diplonema papillatum]